MSGVGRESEEPGVCNSRLFLHGPVSVRKVAGPMNPPVEYAFVNAKIRAKLSFILAPQDIDELADIPRLPEFLRELKECRNFSFLPSELSSPGREAGDIIREIESGISNHFFMEVSGLARVSGSKTLKLAVSALLKSFEIDGLRKILAAVFLGQKPGLSGTEGISGIAASELLESSSPDALLAKLRKTPYHVLLAGSMPEFTKTGSLFAFESALDMFYYRQMYGLRSLLSRRDSTILERILDANVDMKNLEILFRLHGYYGAAAAGLSGYLIPFGGVFKRAARIEQPSPGSLLSLFRFPDPGAAARIAEEKDFSRQALLLERLLEEILRTEIGGLLTRDPFSIGIFLAWYFLRLNENRAVVTLLNGRFYGIPKERTSRAV